MPNQEVISALLENGIRIYQLARRLYISPEELRHELKQHELPSWEKKRMLSIIEIIAREETLDQNIMKSQNDSFFLLENYQG